MAMNTKKAREMCRAMIDDPRTPKHIRQQLDAMIVNCLTKEITRRAPPTSARWTKKLQAEVRQYMKRHPEKSISYVAAWFNINPARIYEEARIRG